MGKSSRKCLANRLSRTLGSTEVIDVPTDLFISRGTPATIRSESGPEIIATTVQARITTLGVKAAYIEPGILWENGTVESFNRKLRASCSRERRSTRWRRPRS